MKVAIVSSWGAPPVYQDADDLPPPSSSQIRLKILATAVHRLVQARAAGKHFSAKSLPIDPSSDGVGVDEATGQLYYIATFAAPTFAEYANVEKRMAAPLPAGTDVASVAALTNPVTSGWMAIKERTADLPKDFSVLIIGATSTSGRAAVSVARTLGAGKIIGSGRNEAALRAVEGLDGYLVQKDPVEQTDFASLGHVDVILDYIYGPFTAALLGSLKTERMTQYVQIGSLGDDSIALPSAVLRSKNLRLTGSAPGAWTLQSLGQQMPDILKLAAAIKRPADVWTAPLKDVESVWTTQDAKTKRLVLEP